MTTHAILPAACLLLFGSGLLRGEYPRYAVATGTELTRKYESSTSLESGPAQMFFGDQEVPREGHGELRLSVEDSRAITFTDAIAAVEGGRPTKFARKYGDLENKATETLTVKPPEGEESVRASTRERTSPFSGKTVRFTWDAKKEEYARACEEKELDPDFLAELQDDADWLPLLEDGPREVGAEFDLEPSLFARVQYPAGDLHWLVDGKEADPASQTINKQLVENLDGKAKAKWQGPREVDGKQLGVFEVEAKLTSHADAETQEGAEKRKVDVEFEYAGEILWDLAAGRLAGYALSADVRSVLSSTRTVESPKGNVEVRQVFDLEGKAKHRLTVTEG